MADSILIDAYGKDRRWEGAVANPVSVDGMVRHNGADTWSIRLQADDPMVPTLSADGARVRLRHRDAAISSGRVRTYSGDVLGQGDVTFQVQGDRRVLDNVLGWARPNRPIRPTLIRNDNVGGGQGWYPALSSDYEAGTADGQWGYYYWAIGLAEGEDPATSDTVEGVVKAFLKANLVTRLGMPGVVIATDQGRGGSSFDALSSGLLNLGTVRFDTLADVLNPILAQLGLGLSVVMNNGNPAQLVVDLYETQEWAAKLTPGSGVLANGSYTYRAPTMTRAVVGGPGELAARAFRDFRDSEGREATYADIIEVLRDATGGSLQWPTTLAEKYRVPAYFHLRPEVSSDAKASFESYLRAAGDKALRESGARTTLNVELSESKTFYVGAGSIRVGDVVTIQAAGQDITDRVTAAKYTWTRGAGVTVTPVVGNREDDPDMATARIVKAIVNGQRRLAADR